VNKKSNQTGMKTQTILILAIALVSTLIYRHYRMQEDMMDTKEQQELINDYLIGGLEKGKPFLWIHTPSDVNARTLAANNTTDLNQPYLLVTMKSIVDKCKSFNVCLVNDDSFRLLVPDWKTDISTLGNPEKERARAVGLTSLLYFYGGLVVPPSTLCFKDLIGLGRGDFAVELPNRGGFKADYRFMGGNKRSPKIGKLLELQKSANNVTDFTGVINDWLGANVTVVDGARVGVKNAEGGRIEIQDLLGKTPLNMNTEAVYIPADEILARPVYGWFLRLSPKEFLKSETAIAELAVKAF
jgi:hypothetical protein